MKDDPATQAEGPVSRRRYQRERRAREEAERLLDQKSRELYIANEALKQQAAALEDTVRNRTADLAKAKATAERASAAKTAFLAMISHEIRTPLNGILGMAEALGDSGLNKTQHGMLEVMAASSQALLSIVNDILDLSKIEAEQLAIEAVEFDFAEVLDAVHRLYEVPAAEKGLTFTCTIDDSARCRIMSDPTRIRQVVSNLVSNAVKFTSDGGIAMSAQLEQGAAGAALLTVGVTDTGPGIPQDKRNRLFKRFSQADASITRRHGGTGLGLWIARKMCHLLGGDLQFAAPVTGGSEFIATFAVRQATGPIAERGREEFDAEAFLMSRHWRVLVAEDNRTNQLVLHHLLKRYPVDLTVTEDGIQAVEAFQGGGFDIVLMDVNMPVMGGMEAAAAIRDIERDNGLAHCPVVALTANAMTHQVEDYLRRGIDGHVAKPVSRAALVARMAELLRVPPSSSIQAELDCALKSEKPATLAAGKA